MRFKTSSGLHCELYDGPNSFQYYSSIRCWGAKLPGTLIEPAQISLEPGAVPTYDQADLSHLESQYEPGFKTSRIDPGRYRELAPGQKIIVPGAHPGSAVDMNDEICAVDHDATLICEIQHPDPSWGDGKVHGFRLTTSEGHLY